MAKALTNFPDRQARLLAIPSPDLSLSSPVFKEALSSHLLLPSLAMREGVWHGREVPGGGVAIDLFGVSIMTSHHIPGDSCLDRGGWRLGELQMARVRQGKVPDYRFLLPTPDGPKNQGVQLAKEQIVYQQNMNVL